MTAKRQTQPVPDAEASQPGQSPDGPGNLGNSGDPDGSGGSGNPASNGSPAKQSSNGNPNWLYAPSQVKDSGKVVSLPLGVVDGYGPETGMSPAQEWVLAREGDGTESPRELKPTAKYMMVHRTFGFIDMSGFTAITQQRGPAIAADLLTAFRRETRLVASLRGVRVAKWMGDGAMIVSPEPARTIATAAHIIHHFRATHISVRVGLAAGEALLFEGDDYIGGPVNLAFRLCEAAKAGEILADVPEGSLPDWVHLLGTTEVEIRGVGQVDNILRLQPELR